MLSEPALFTPLTNKLQKVSVLIPVLNEEKYIPNLLTCLKSQTYRQELMQIVVVDGGSTDRTLEVITKLSGDLNLNVFVVSNPKQIPATGLNVALSASDGEIIIRMDGHSTYETTYIQKVVDKIQADSTLCNVGGVTTAIGLDVRSRSIAAVVNSSIGVGGAKWRYSTEPIETDTVFPGTWWRKDLELIKGWNETWKVNEDVELNFRLRQMTGRRIMVYPDIRVTYYPRQSPDQLAKQYFRYGYWRNKTSVAHPPTMRLSHVAPPSLVISLVTLAGLSVWSTTSRWLLVLEILTYFLAVLRSAMRLKSPNHVRLYDLFAAITTIHMSWGLGNIVGYFRFGVPVKGIRGVLLRGVGRN